MHMIKKAMLLGIGLISLTKEKAEERKLLMTSSSGER